MGGADGMGDIRWAENTRYVGDQNGEGHEVQINPGRAGMSLVDQLMEFGPMQHYANCLNDALDIIEDILKLGEHEGRCTNIDAPEERCSLHWEATHARWERANAFLRAFRPYEHIDVPEEVSGE